MVNNDLTNVKDDINSLNSNLDKKFAKTGTLRSGTATIASGTSLITVFESKCTMAGTYILTSNINFSCKGCDVAVALFINNEAVLIRNFRATSVFIQHDTIEKFVDLKNGDVVSIKVCQNSGSDATVNYDYNYRG